MRSFSPSFMRDAGLLDFKSAAYAGFSSDLGFDAPAWCLNDLAAQWRQVVEALAVDSVDKTLTLVYRLQPLRSAKTRETESGSKHPATSYMTEQERTNLALAIEASLNGAPNQFDGRDDGLARAIEESLQTARAVGQISFNGVAGEQSGNADSKESTPKEVSLELPAVLSSMPDPGLGSSDSAQTPAIAEREDTSAESSVAPLVIDSLSGEDTSSEDGDTPMPESELNKKAQILGSKQFTMDDNVLDDYLTSILRWWHGQRPPKGVDIELTRRCR